MFAEDLMPFNSDQRSIKRGAPMTERQLFDSREPFFPAQDFHYGTMSSNNGLPRQQRRNNDSQARMRVEDSAVGSATQISRGNTSPIPRSTASPYDQFRPDSGNSIDKITKTKLIDGVSRSKSASTSTAASKWMPQPGNTGSHTPMNTEREEIQQRAVNSLKQEVISILDRLAAVEEEQRQAKHRHDNKWMPTVHAFDDEYMEHQRLDGLQREFDRLSNRLAILEGMHLEGQKTARHRSHDVEQLNKYHIPSDSDIIYVNVGGSKMDVLRGTLTFFPDSLLATQFSGQWDDTFVTDNEGRFMIDEDPELFAELVNYLREQKRRVEHGEVTTDPPMFEQSHRQEAFYRLVDSYHMTNYMYRMPVSEDPLDVAVPTHSLC
jgi:hypothetical protein